MTTLTFKDLTLSVQHSAKRRTIGITIDRDGQLIISAPVGISLDILRQAVEKQSLWIYRHLLRKEALNPKIVEKEYVTGEGFYYLGRSYRLKLVDEELVHPTLKLHQGRFYLQRSAQTQGREQFIDWYRNRLKPYLVTKIDSLTDRIGAKPRSIQVRELNNRWGSCNQQGDLYFHWRVAMLPPNAIEYVVVHEMVHLIEHQHSQEFWSRVERVLPNYRELKEWLATDGCNYGLSETAKLG